MQPCGDAIEAGPLPRMTPRADDPAPMSIRHDPDAPRAGMLLNIAEAAATGFPIDPSDQRIALNPVAFAQCGDLGLFQGPGAGFVERDFQIDFLWTIRTTDITP